MKRIAALLLLVILLFSGCVGNNDFLIGEQMSEINNRQTPYISLNTLSAYEIDGSCLVVVEDGGVVQKIAEFSYERKCKRVQNINLIKAVDINQFLNMNVEDVKKMLGQPHADIGSGFYIPAYITEDANLISFQIENNIVFEVIKRDLITNKIISQIEN